MWIRLLFIIHKWDSGTSHLRISRRPLYSLSRRLCPSSNSPQKVFEIILSEIKLKNNGLLNQLFGRGNDICCNCLKRLYLFEIFAVLCTLLELSRLSRALLQQADVGNGQQHQSRRYSSSSTVVLLLWWWCLPLLWHTLLCPIVSSYSRVQYRVSTVVRAAEQLKLSVIALRNHSLCEATTSALFLPIVASYNNYIHSNPERGVKSTWCTESSVYGSAKHHRIFRSFLV